MQLRKLVKSLMFSLISYLIIVIISYVFTYIFQLKENYVLLYMVLIAPIFDGILFLYLKNNVRVELNSSSENIEKNNNLVCSIEIENIGFITIPFVDYELSYSEKFLCDEDIISRASIARKDKICLELEFLPIHRGVGEIEVTNIYARSLLGLFKKKIEDDDCSKKINIMPALVEVEGAEYLLENREDAAEEEDTTNNLMAGEPWYEFKEYSEGDPLNRVNWKLSSKKNILMIRKSTNQIKHRKILILDQAISVVENKEEIEDLIIESLISIVTLFIKHDVDIDLIVRDNGGWRGFNQEESQNVVYLQKYFSSYEFKGNNSLKNRFNGIEVGNVENSDYIIFTGNKDKELSDLLTLLEERGDRVMVISNNGRRIFEEELLLNKDYSLERI